MEAGYGSAINIPQSGPEIGGGELLVEAGYGSAINIPQSGPEVEGGALIVEAGYGSAINMPQTGPEVGSVASTFDLRIYAEPDSYGHVGSDVARFALYKVSDATYLSGTIDAISQSGNPFAWNAPATCDGYNQTPPGGIYPNNGPATHFYWAGTSGPPTYGSMIVYYTGLPSGDYQIHAQDDVMIGYSGDWNLKLNASAVSGGAGQYPSGLGNCYAGTLTWPAGGPRYYALSQWNDVGNRDCQTQAGSGDPCAIIYHNFTIDATGTVKNN